MNKKLIIILALVVLLGGGAAAYFLFFAPDGEEVPEEVILYQFTPGDHFVTNVKDSNRLFQTTMILVYDDMELEPTLTAETALIRDTIIFLLRDMSEVQFTTPGVEDELRDTVVRTLNQQLQTDALVDVYFNDFVLS